MKKILMTIVMAAMSVTALFAQQSGDRSLGFTGGCSFSDIADVPNTFTAGIEGQCGFFFVNNLKIGIDAIYDFERQNVDNDANYLTHWFGFGPTVSYYVRITDKLYYTPEIIGNIMRGRLVRKPTNSYHYYYGENSQTLKGRRVAVVPFQIEFHPTERIGITASVFALTAEYYEGIEDDTVCKGGYRINFGLNPTVGVVFYLSREKSSL